MMMMDDNDINIKKKKRMRRRKEKAEPKCHSIGTPTDEYPPLQKKKIPQEDKSHNIGTPGDVYPPLQKKIKTPKLILGCLPIHHIVQHQNCIQVVCAKSLWILHNVTIIISSISRRQPQNSILSGDLGTIKSLGRYPLQTCSIEAKKERNQGLRQKELTTIISSMSRLHPQSRIFCGFLAGLAMSMKDASLT